MPTSNICGSHAAQANWKSLIDSWLAIQPLPHPWQTCDLGISKLWNTQAKRHTLQRRSGWHDDSPGQSEFCVLTSPLLFMIPSLLLLLIITIIITSHQSTLSFWIIKAWQPRTLILLITFQKQPKYILVSIIKTSVFTVRKHQGVHSHPVTTSAESEAKHRSKRRLRKSSANSSVQVQVFGLTSSGGRSSPQWEWTYVVYTECFLLLKRSVKPPP